MSHHTIIWTSADQQGTIDMSGEYTDAEGQPVSCATARRMALADLLAQCGTPADHDGIMAGTIAVDDHDPEPCR